MRRTEFQARNEVLLVADNRDALVLYAISLERDGFTVFSTSSAPNASAFVKAGRPPNALVVVASLCQPDDWAAIEPLLAAASDAAVPVVLVTASVRADERHRRRAFEYGCAAFVPLPCAPDELTAVLRRVIAGEVEVVPRPSQWSQFR